MEEIQNNIEYIKNVFNQRLELIEQKLNALWDYNIRRARTETLYKGFGVEKSPLIITEDTRKKYDHLIPELKSFYKNLGVLLTYRELFIMINEKFGDRIFKDICVPYGLTSGACIDIAVTLCKEEDEPSAICSD